MSASVYVMRNATDDVLYVGKMQHPIRWRSHERIQPWWLEVHHVEVHHCGNELDALRYERELITELCPRHNCMGVPGRKRGPEPKYDWATWTNGRAWRITRGEDFAVEMPAARMRNVVTSYAGRKGLRVQTSVRDENNVEFQFSESRPLEEAA